MKNKNKNLRRISIVINSQTLWHLEHLSAMAGYNSKNLGRVIDKLIINYCNEQRINDERSYENYKKQ